MLVQVSLSICLIIKNEEKYLSRCLSSIKDIASEIIVVDTGSTDNSILITSEYTDQIYSCKWKDDFSLARNFCLDKAEGDWILVLDGDEEVDRKCLDLLTEIIQVQDIDAYLVTINNNPENTQELMAISDLQPRLFRNNKQYRYRGIIYEQILDSILRSKPYARIEIARDIHIMHYGYVKEDKENRHRLMRNTDLISKALYREEEEAIKYFYLGREYYLHHKFADALVHFLFVYDQADLQADYFPELLRSISVSLYMLDRSADALTFIDNALTILADMGDLHYIKAVVYKNNYEYAKAYRAYKKCLTLPDQSFHYSSVYCQYKDKIYFYMGCLAEYFVDKDHALFFFLESLKHNPYMLDSLRRIIGILNPRVNPEYTIESLNRVFDLSDRALQVEMALMFYEEGAYQLALDNINKLEKSAPISEHIRSIKGLCLLRNKQYSEAEEELQKINSNKNFYISARKYLLIYYWLVQDYRKAAGCLKRIKNAGAEPAINYVLNLLIRGYTDKTNTVQDQAYILAKQIMELVIELDDNDRVDEAFQNLAPILGERPSRLLAEIFYKCEKYELAEKEFRYLLETDNTDAQAFYYLGKTFWARGNLHGAENYLCQAINNGLETPKIRLEVARLYQELAIESLREGFKDCPDSEERQKLLQELKDKMLEV
jgi:glycosyltransferase involved in cell wall biosynthesis